MSLVNLKLMTTNGPVERYSIDLHVAYDFINLVSQSLGIMSIRIERINTGRVETFKYETAKTFKIIRSEEL
jgi:hypothetical protein